MKPEVTLKYLSYLRSKKQNGEQGFTLIELLVVVIIIGVLAAVALPNLLSQVGKARETEIKNAVGTSLRAEQAYHFERQTFTSDLGELGVTIEGQYIDDTTGFISVSGDTASVQPVNSSFANDGTRAYSGAIAHSGGDYQQIVCQSNEPAASIGVTATFDGPQACLTGSVEVK